MAHSQLSWNVLFFSCNLIGQLCLSGPGYSTENTYNCHIEIALLLILPSPGCRFDCWDCIFFRHIILNKAKLSVSSAWWPLNRGENNRLTLDRWVGQSVALAAYQSRGLMSRSFVEGGSMRFFPGAFSSNSHLDIRED